MNYKECIMHMLKKTGNTKKGLARKVGRDPSSITMLFRREGLQVRTLQMLARAMGYEIVLRPQNYVRLMDEEILLDE